MNLEPAPRLPKWTFFVIDALLILAAFLTVSFAKDPYAPLPFIFTVVFVILAAVIGLVPFLIDYAADSAEYVQRERERVSEQVQRLQAATESLARAAAQIKAVEEAVHKSAHAAENLPYRMQEKLAEFNEALAEKENGEREALETELEELRSTNSSQLKATADKIHQAAADWSAVEAATRKQLAAAQEATRGLEEKLRAALGEIDTRIARLREAAAVLTPPAASAMTPVAPAKVEFQTDAQDESPAAALVESVSVVESTAAAPSPVGLEEAKPKKPRAPRKPKPEETLAAMSAPSAEPEAGPSSESAFPDSAGEPSAGSATRSEPVEPAASSDGATRLLATAYIGIGNKLYIRGDGPGLNWEKGVPMQFVSIGKWGWASHDATAPVRAKLYKNDETAALSGEVILEPGKHVEVTALF